MGIEQNFARTTQASPAFGRASQYLGAVGGAFFVALAVLCFVNAEMWFGLFMLLLGAVGIFSSVMYARARCSLDARDAAGSY